MGKIHNPDIQNPARNSNEIQIRRMDFEFSDGIPRFWFDNNPVATAFLAALSVTFPPGERFFIDSVRHYQKRVHDPQLVKAIRGFIGQEGNHSKEHIAFNQFLDSLGYPATQSEASARQSIVAVQKRSSPETNLARTVALEHFTAIMAGSLLENPWLLEKMDPVTARLWAWHAIEEVEHRSVAFDVYKLTVDEEGRRLLVMCMTTFFFLMVTAIRTAQFTYHSGNLFNLRSWFATTNLLWGRPGVLRRLIPQYLDYFRRDFHPDQHDIKVSLDKIKQRWLSDTLPPSPVTPPA